MAPRFWLVKQEPADYPWSQLVADGETAWTGVRSFPARMHLRGMQVGDRVLYYHSGESREVVGVARVTRSAYPDPTAAEGEWVAVNLAPVEFLAQPVGLAAIKSDSALRGLPLIRQSRLSVMPVGAAEFAHLVGLGGLRPLSPNSPSPQPSPVGRERVPMRLRGRVRGTAPSSGSRGTAAKTQGLRTRRRASD